MVLSRDVSGCIVMAEGEFNPGATEAVLSDAAYSAFLSWAHSNGVLHPSLEVPCAFGDPPLLGVRALRPIPSLKAIMFVPYRICLSLQAADRILGPLFALEPDLFLTNKYKNDYRLYTLLIHEKLKGESSFYSPYFRILHDAEILTDWSDAEIQELQDPGAIFRVTTYRKVMQKYWSELSPVLERHPDYFPPTDNMYSLFFWVYKIVQTRSFAWGNPEGMLIPVADFFNHRDIYAGYETCSPTYLQENANNEETYIDYSDFNGGNGQNREKKEFNSRSFKGKLEKFMINTENCEKIRSLEAIWKVDDIINDESSSDDDLPVHLNSDSEDEKDSSPAPLPQTEEDYFVLSSGSKGSFLPNEEVCICYGRKRNLDLLLFYGFVPEENYRDSVSIPVENRIFRVKFNRLNQEVIESFRKELVEELVRQGVFKEEVKETLGIRPVLGNIEMAVLRKVLNYYRLFRQARFRTTEEEDRSILSQNPPFRLKTAVFYRISQRRILTRQIDLIDSLLTILAQIKSGAWSFPLISKSQSEIETLYPLRNYLRAYEANRHTWSHSFSPS